MAPRLPEPMLDEITNNLRAIHPGLDVPAPIGSAFMHWGSDPREIAWTFWRAGVNSDDAMPQALPPGSCDPDSRLRRDVLPGPSLGRGCIGDRPCPG